MRTATLEFEEYPDDEVVIRISPVPVAAFFDVTDKVNNLHWDPAEFAAISDLFVPFLVSWTFDTPIDKGVFGHDLTLGVGIVREWAKAVRDVPLPLPVTPFDGTPSEAPSQPDSTEPSSSSES